MSNRLLIVEDSAIMRELLSNAANIVPDIEIHQAQDGASALKLIRSAGEPYDLIMMDLNMPIMDGMKLLGFLKKERSAIHTTVAMVTTEASPETEQQARSLGARYYLRKPVKRGQVEDLLKEVFCYG